MQSTISYLIVSLFDSAFAQVKKMCFAILFATVVGPVFKWVVISTVAVVFTPWAT